MNSSPSVADLLREHVTLEVEGIDRMYLNVYVPNLQMVLGIVGFFKGHKGSKFVSSVLMDPISKAFVQQIEAFAESQEAPEGDRRATSERTPPLR